MLRKSRLIGVAAAMVITVGLAACSSSTPAGEPTSAAAAAEWTPVSITHAFGTTTIDAKPERVATVQWANHEVPLALGIVPVGMAAANFGDDDADGLLPWVKEKLD